MRCEHCGRHKKVGYVRCNHCGVYIPTRAEIREECRRMQESWSPKVEQGHINAECDKTIHAEIEVYHVSWGKGELNG